MQKQRPFWIFTAAVLVALILPTLMQDGMFMDGLLYACVSKNMADGIGSFWFPHFSKTLHAFFDQQPPLGFGILAVFFKLFGSSLYVERGYCFLTALANALLIATLWRSLFKQENEIKQLSWLPVFFWITIPVCFWAYSNGVMENTMSVFDLLAVLCVTRFFRTGSFAVFFLTGAFIFLASLTKGIQGMFPLVSFFAGWIAYRNFAFGKMILYSVMLLLIPLAIYILLLQNDAAFGSLNAYLHNRVLNSIQNVETDDGRFYLAGRLLSELIPMSVFSLILFLAGRKSKSAASPVPYYKRHFLFFILLGISASFPLMVTLEQRGFYLVTSFPYFAIAASALAAPYLSILLGKINVVSNGLKLFRTVSILLLAGALVFSFLQIGKASRDRDTIHDVHLIGAVVPRGDIMGGTPTLWSQWSFQEYLIRHYYISLGSTITHTNDYVILETGTSVPDSENMEKVNIPTLRYHLYKVKR